MFHIGHNNIDSRYTNDQGLTLQTLPGKHHLAPWLALFQTPWTPWTRVPQRWQIRLVWWNPTTHLLQMQCLPLASLLLALKNPTINYLSLDLEGAELEVPSIFWDSPCSCVVSQSGNNCFNSLESLVFLAWCDLNLQVIKTIPFKQLDIEVLSVEFNLLGRFILLLKASDC